jgi:hypothetical protein
MNIHYQTEVKIAFKQGQELEVTIVSDGDFIMSEVFSNKTHQWEEVLDFIETNENSGFDVFI